MTQTAVAVDSVADTAWQWSVGTVFDADGRSVLASLWNVSAPRLPDGPSTPDHAYYWGKVTLACSTRESLSARNLAETLKAVVAKDYGYVLPVETLRAIREACEQEMAKP